MFGIRRRKSRAVLARAELGESFDHLRQAAAYATGGVGEAVSPRVRTARAYVAPKAARVRNTAAGGWGSTVAVLMPLATVATRQARRISPIPGRSGGAMLQTKMSKKQVKKAMRGAPMMRGKMSSKGNRRWPVAGLLVAGAIAGTAGFMALRRRRESEWEAYDPAADLDVVHPGGTAAAAGGQPERVRSSMAGDGRSTGTTTASGGMTAASGGTTTASTGTTAASTGTTAASGGTRA